MFGISQEYLADVSRVSLRTIQRIAILSDVESTELVSSKNWHDKIQP